MRKILTAVALTAVTAAIAVPALATTRTIKIGYNYFVRNGSATVTVRKGTKVTWKWTGHAPHNVVVTKGPRRFKSNVQQRGTFSQVLRRAGRYSIVCTIHQPAMKMTLVVR